MKRMGWAVSLTVVFVLAMGAGALSAEPFTVVLKNAEEITEVALESFSQSISGTVAYQGPVFDESDPNWKASHTYFGVPVRILVEVVGGMTPEDTVSIVAVDGFSKTLPYAAVYETTPGGTPIIAFERGDPEWDGAPMLVFLAEDEAFSNDDMLATVGAEYAHYYGGDKLSTTGMMVKGVGYIVVNYDGVLPLAVESATSPSETDKAVDSDPVVTIIHGDQVRQLARTDLQIMDVITAQGTHTNSAGADCTATYTGVPMATLIGNVPGDATIRVTAADGYSMNYEASMFLGVSEGTWILAFEEDGELMPFDPGYYRIVQVGDPAPHFTSSLSARMVERIEVLGTYTPYSLMVSGAVVREFLRGELEAGIGCPCHTAEVSVTSKGSTSVYAGLPLWRLIAYVDDQVFPSVEDGIHYNDEDFNDDLAAADYTVVLVAEDGYTQTVTSSQIARDDRFVVAFKEDGVFLDPSRDGFMRFVYDDSVELPEGTKLRSVKFLTEIRIEF